MRYAVGGEYYRRVNPAKKTLLDKLFGTWNLELFLVQDQSLDLKNPT